jgi:hypothetical protein
LETTASGPNESPRRSSRLRTRAGWKMSNCRRTSCPPAHVKISSRNRSGRLWGPGNVRIDHGSVRLRPRPLSSRNS